MKSSFLQNGRLVTLIAFCTTATLAAQPRETDKPDARQAGVTHSDLKAFPPAKVGMERFVIVLPRKEHGEEEALRVELIPGKMMETDGVNLYSIAATLEEKHLEGWPYSFYEIGDGPVKMTAMKPGTIPVTKFVKAPSLLARYISRLPLVIYAPAGYEGKRSTEHLSHLRQRSRISRSYATAVSSAVAGSPWAFNHAAGRRPGSSSSAGLCMSLPKTHSK